MVIVLCAMSFAIGRMIAPTNQVGNFTQEMKFTTTDTLNDSGADVYDRSSDHKEAPYFYSADIYNMESTEARFILPHFKTMNQTSWWSCGQASILMVLEHYNMRGDWNEEKLATIREDHVAEKCFIVVKPAYT